MGSGVPSFAAAAEPFLWQVAARPVAYDQNERRANQDDTNGGSLLGAEKGHDIAGKESLLEKPYDLAAGAALEGDPSSCRRRQEDRVGRVAP
jgi:hypothetical protein